jgi:antirestriction protein ArdC
MPKRNRNRRALTDEERAEKRAAERELIAEAVDGLRSSEGWQRWLRLRRHFHTYSFRNQILIAQQMPYATRVAGFRKWLDLGYAVRKAETGIRIYAPCPPAKPALARWRREGADPDAKPKTHFRMVSVFDRSQVDPLPDFPGGVVELDPPVEPIEGSNLARFLLPLQGFAGSIGYSFAIEPIRGAADGFCDRDTKRIVVRPVADDFSPNAQVSTTVHEDSHALLDADREDGAPKLTRGQEEVVVECVAFSVCSTLGLDTSASAVPYMASWGEGEDIERYGALIDRLASRIEDALLSDPQPPAVAPSVSEPLPLAA